MLTYTFSKREKALMVLLALMLIGVVWYLVVFQGVNNQITTLEGQISDVETQMTLDQAQLAKMNQMQQAIDEALAQGVEPMELPAYDNQQAVMTELNGILGATDSYTVNFDNVDMESSEYVQRKVSISFGCQTYELAEAVARALAEDGFPCTVNSIDITDKLFKENTANNNSVAYDVSQVLSGGRDSNVSPIDVNMTATFYESIG